VQDIYAQTRAGEYADKAVHELCAGSGEGHSPARLILKLGGTADMFRPKHLLRAIFLSVL